MVIPLFVLLVAAYGGTNYLAPDILYVVDPPDTTAKRLVSQRPSTEENRLYIPKINADIELLLGDGEISETGATVRSTASGNPKDGGNFVITANRFSLGYTPQETKAKSPFYHLTKLSVGDDIYVDYEGMRYAYKVEERKAVDDVTELQERTDNPRLTLYTSETSKREAVIAKQVGKIVWTSGQPKLQPLPDS